MIFSFLTFNCSKHRGDVGLVMDDNTADYGRSASLKNLTGVTKLETVRRSILHRYDISRMTDALSLVTGSECSAGSNPVTGHKNLHLLWCSSKPLSFPHFTGAVQLKTLT